MVMEPAVDPQVCSTSCPDDDTLRAFALGDLSDEGIESVRRHLEACAACEARAEALDDRTDHVLDELRRSLSAPERRPAADAPPGPLDEGPPVLTDYVIEGPPIGVGSTGLIYKARHIKLGRAAALKMIARRPDVVSRLFEIEAKAVAQLQHPNIVQIYDIGSHGDRPFLALEFVDGGSLEDRIAAGSLDARVAAETIRMAAEAVDHAHRHGIVHCDLKPSNILMTRDGVPKIADFGIAKWTESDGYWGEDGGRRGTPRYMAPEQAGGAGEVGPATDVYSLGTILYEMLTGRVPHADAPASETLKSVREAEPQPPSRLRPDVPRELDRIVMRCLRKRPEDRYPGPLALAGDLRRFLDGSARPSVGGAGKLAVLAASVLATLAVAASAIAPVPPVPPVEAAAAPTTADQGLAQPPPRSQGGDPELTTKTVVQDDGSIRLGAASAVLSGEYLRFEGSFGNLGYWHGREDEAAWTFLIEPESAGRYSIGLDYANRDGEAANPYEVKVDGLAFQRAARSTGAWSDYRTFPIADVDMGPGVHTIEIRPLATPRGALFDLRAVILSPVEP